MNLRSISLSGSLPDIHVHRNTVILRRLGVLYGVSSNTQTKTKIMCCKYQCRISTATQAPLIFFPSICVNLIGICDVTTMVFVGTPLVRLVLGKILQDPSSICDLWIFSTGMTCLLLKRLGSSKCHRPQKARGHDHSLMLVHELSFYPVSLRYC